MNPREGKPSASGIERIMRCPGSWNLEKDIPESVSTEDAASGTRIHEALSGNQAARDSLTEDERETYEICENLAAQFISAQNLDGATLYTEERIWDASGSHSGQFDRAYEKGPRVAVIDFKTGRNEADNAASNWQLRALSVLSAQRFNHAEEIFCAIIQPWCSPQVTVALYTIDDLVKADREISGGLEAAEEPNAPRLPGKHCKFCKALGICPEAATTALQAIPPSNVSLASLSPEERGKRLDAARYADGVFAAWRKEAKELLQADPESVAGYRMKPGNEVREVANAAALYFAVSGGLGVNMDTFLSHADVSFGWVKPIFKEQNGLKGKAADEAFDTFIQPYVTTKQNAPSLERVK